MARIEAVAPQEIKDKLKIISQIDNRSITKELIYLIENRYKELKCKILSNIE